MYRVDVLWASEAAVRVALRHLATGSLPPTDESPDWPMLLRLGGLLGLGSLRAAALQYLVYSAEQERAIAAVSELVEGDERAKLLRAIAALALRWATTAPVGDCWLSREGMHDRLAEAVAVLLQAEPPAQPNA